MLYFPELYEASRVKRYHTVATISEQNLAQHSWGVAMIVGFIVPDALPDVRLGRVLLAALTHDLAERLTGDIPSDAKWENKDLDRALMRLEKEYNKAHEIEFKLTEKEQSILEWADMFEGLLWTDHEIQMGNSRMMLIHQRYRSWFQPGCFPTSEAKQLWDSWHDFKG